jgi:hypothetical protein
MKLLPCLCVFMAVIAPFQHLDQLTDSDETRYIRHAFSKVKK